jgi:hypothetical protein
MQRSPGLLFYLSMFVLVGVTMLMHEASHWLAARALGAEMWFTLTRGGPMAGYWDSQAQYALVSAAGPAFTIAMGLTGAWLAIRNNSLFGYELIFAAFMQRLMAMVLSAIGTLNDEARISVFLGLTWWILPALVVGGLLWLTIWSSHALRLSMVTNLLCFVVVSAAITALVAADGQLPGGNGVSILNPLLPESVRR